VRFELTLPGPSCRCLLPLGYEGIGAATRCRPGSPAVRERGRSRARRPSWRPRARTWTFLIQSQACCRITPVSIGTGGAIRTRTGRGLGPRSPAIGLRPRAPPEPRTPFPGVRARCITRHACGAWSNPAGSNGYPPEPSARHSGLQATFRWSGTRDSNPHSQLGRLAPCHWANAAWWLLARSNRRPAGFQPAALPSELKSHEAQDSLDRHDI
jgi:hypothetical protein